MIKTHLDVNLVSFLINQTHHLLVYESRKNKMNKQTCAVFLSLRPQISWNPGHHP